MDILLSYHIISYHIRVSGVPVPWLHLEDPALENRSSGIITMASTVLRSSIHKLIQELLARSVASGAAISNLYP